MDGKHIARDFMLQHQVLKKSVFFTFRYRSESHANDAIVWEVVEVRRSSIHSAKGLIENTQSSK